MTTLSTPQPSAGAIDPEHWLPVFRLDPLKLGDMLMQLGALSHRLGHASPRETVKSYWSREHLDSLEQQFIYDMIAGRSEDMAERWYGGSLNAKALSTGFSLMAAGQWDDLHAIAKTMRESE